jgi:hypothetical protein
LGSNGSSNTGHSGLSSGAAAGIGIGVALGVIAIVGAILFFLYKRRAQRNAMVHEAPDYTAATKFDRPAVYAKVSELSAESQQEHEMPVPPAELEGSDGTHSENTGTHSSHT